MYEKIFGKEVLLGAKNANERVDPNSPCFKLWHLNGGIESVSNRHNLLTFYELDSPTEAVSDGCDPPLTETL